MTTSGSPPNCPLPSLTQVKNGATGHRGCSESLHVVTSDAASGGKDASPHACDPHLTPLNSNNGSRHLFLILPFGRIDRCLVDCSLLLATSLFVGVDFNFH